jgi:hypothetical protein
MNLLKNYSQQINDLNLKLKKAEKLNYSKNIQHSTIDAEFNSFMGPKISTGMIVKNT